LFVELCCAAPRRDTFLGWKSFFSVDHWRRARVLRLRLLGRVQSFPDCGGARESDKKIKNPVMCDLLYYDRKANETTSCNTLCALFLKDVLSYATSTVSSEIQQDIDIAEH